MTIHWNGDAPIYIQLYQQVIKRILDGNIKEGEALPYQMLQDEHYVEKQRGKGLFVKLGTAHNILEKERTSFLSIEWPLILQQISRLKLSVEELPRTTKENK